ncbi:Carbonyl reductase [NADPH] 1 [Micractinium conductrix]|uniref:Carbonyl reductase [NADPH] 1 n=1 Tax=Micractinium conductrix TaxID=554055 RepID=A0A2P6VDK8_9CHLO|nr:Carbonyl reductase [NADPH] 1 [Micractinium conductrix]|eukprot:PSC72175.1 Carbonyl reductase [NADPH] 1 [Micractinium conductrix]
MPPFTSIVTGANQGIGLEIARQLVRRPDSRTVVAARNPERGQAAVADLKSHLPAADIRFHQLDITDADSVQLGSINALINNAGFAFKGNAFGGQEAETTLGVNYWGTKRVCTALEPLLSDGGRIINVCSAAGKLSIVRDAALRKRFEECASLQELDELADGFVAAVSLGNHRQHGWPDTMYGVSKLCEATLTRILARRLAPRCICVEAMCPGWCSTNMSSYKGPRSAAEGADTAAWLATEAPLTPGEAHFWRDRAQEGF